MFKKVLSIVLCVSIIIGSCAVANAEDIEKTGDVYFDDTVGEVISLKSSGEWKQNLAHELVLDARSFIGKIPYSQVNPQSLSTHCDCSYFVQQMFLRRGLNVGRFNMYDRRFEIGTLVADKSQVRDGDIIVYDGHVAICTSDGTVVEQVAGNVRNVREISIYKANPGVNVRCIIRPYCLDGAGDTYRKITFDANGGEIFNSGGFTLEGNTASVKNGDTFGQMPSVSKSGVYFVGWYMENNTTSRRIKSGDTIDLDGNITLYAQYTEAGRNFVIEEDLCMLDWNKMAGRVKFGGDYQYARVISKKGDDLSQAEDKWTMVGDIIYRGDDNYGYFEIDPSLFKYDSKGESGVSVAPCNISGDPVYNIAESVPSYRPVSYPVRGGSCGFYEAGDNRRLTFADNNGVIYKNSELFGVEDIAATDYFFITKRGSTYGENICEVHKNDGIYNKTLPLPIPEKDGYTFKGWYTKMEGGTEITNQTICYYEPNVENIFYAHFERDAVDNTDGSTLKPTNPKEPDNHDCVGGEPTCKKQATLSSDGVEEIKCTKCGKTIKTNTIFAAETIKLTNTKYTYNGKAIKPSVTIKDSNGNKIASSNYTITYPGQAKNVGKYTVKVTFKNRYSGDKDLSFTINPQKTSIRSLAPRSKSFVVKWAKKTQQVTGYEIQYSTSKKFASGNKTINVTSAKSISKTVKKLRAKKKYYVRIRTYKTVNKKKYYSSWSEKKAVKTK